MQEHDCPICYDPITAASGEVRMSCNHTFHLSCIGTWLQAGNHSCPYCRTDLQETERLAPVVAAAANPGVVAILDNIANYMNNIVYYNLAEDVVADANQALINVAYLNNLAQQNLFNDQQEQNLMNQQNQINWDNNQQEQNQINWNNNQQELHQVNRNWINNQPDRVNGNWINNQPHQVNRNWINNQPPQDILG
uniref:RING-type domain-containing protein n=1 Tax=viral metagenome TaxID=1070528 RepID=A0A6C0DSY6_9ZZZZ